MFYLSLSGDYFLRKKNNVMNLVNNLVKNFSVRTEVKEGIPHIVVPIVALVEGVHSGSGGSAYYSIAELEKTAGQWNGVPLTINHPTIRGDKVSALDPTIMKEWSVGTFENTFYEAGKLKGEGWFNVEKLSQLSPEILVKIKQGEEIEVSTGFFSKTDNMKGTWNGEEFEESILDIIPDHLAILPHNEGACNLRDGCGIRDEGECVTCRLRNVKNVIPLVQEGIDDTKVIGITTSSTTGDSVIWDKIIIPEGGEEEIKVNVNELKKAGFYVNELSHSKLRESLMQQVNQMDSAGTMHFLREVFNDHFIFEKLSESGSQLFSQKFSVKTNNDEIKLKGEPVEVREKVEFLPLEMNKNQKIEEAVMERKELVEALITNEKTPYDESDRDSLIALSEEKFDRIIQFVDCKCKEQKTPVVNEKIEEVKEKSQEITVNEETEVKEETKALTYAEILASATPEDREFIENGTRMYKEEKAKAVNALLANSRNPFSKESLETKSLKELKELAQLGNISVSYKGNSPKEEAVFNANERQSDGSGVPKVRTLSSLIQETAKKE